MKWLLDDLYGYGSKGRRPLPCISEEEGKEFKDALKEILEIEKKLEKEASTTAQV